MDQRFINISDFKKIQIAVGTITEVMDFPEARKPAWKLKIDFGTLGIKMSSAQITKIYSKPDLLNRQIIAVINFPPKQIGNFMSECLVLGITDNLGAVVLLKPDQQVENGLIVT